MLKSIKIRLKAEVLQAEGYVVCIITVTDACRARR